MAVKKATKTEKKTNVGHRFTKDNQPAYKPGAPKAVIDEAKLIELASHDYTMDEIAAELDVHLDTIYARFSETLKKGRLKGNGSLKRRIFQKAMSGDMSALIWLTKNRCGYKDKQPEEATQITFNINIDPDAK